MKILYIKIPSNAEHSPHFVHKEQLSDPEKHLTKNGLTLSTNEPL